MNTDNKEKMVHIRIPEKLYKELKVRCVYDDTSVQEFVENLIKDNIAGYTSKKQVGKGKTNM